MERRPTESLGEGRGLRLIALYKFAKSILLVVAALALLQLLAPGAAARFGDWAARLPVAAERRLAVQLVGTLTGHGPGRLHLVAGMSLAFATLFAAEGTGLWLRRRWGGYLTVIATGCGLPVECWELVRRPTWLAAGALLANAAILVYLVRRVGGSAGLSD